MYNIIAGAVHLNIEERRNFPLFINIIQPDGEWKTIMNIDDNSNIDISGSKEEFVTVINDPANRYSGWVLKPIVLLAIEILNLREQVAQQALLKYPITERNTQ